jgi:hypothetical protein
MRTTATGPQALYFWMHESLAYKTRPTRVPISSARRAVSIVVHYKDLEASAGADAALSLPAQRLRQLHRTAFVALLCLCPATTHRHYNSRGRHRSVDNTEYPGILNNRPRPAGASRTRPFTVALRVRARPESVPSSLRDTTQPTAPTLIVPQRTTFVQTGDDVILASYQNPITTSPSAVFLDSTSRGRHTHTLEPLARRRLSRIG